MELKYLTEKRVENQEQPRAGRALCYQQEISIKKQDKNSSRRTRHQE